MHQRCLKAGFQTLSFLSLYILFRLPIVPIRGLAIVDTSSQLRDKLLAKEFGGE